MAKAKDNAGNGPSRVVKTMALRDDIDAALASLWDHLRERQAAFFARHKRFFQGIVTHDTLPVDGEEKTPDLGRKPTDQAETWADAGFALPAKMPYRMRVDVYEGPRGHGWSATVGVVINGKRFVRTLGEGAETDRREKWWAEKVDGLPDSSGDSVPTKGDATVMR